MKFIGDKHPRLKLTLGRYRRLRHQVLERDGWRCQACGSMRHLQLHHQKFRSHCGDDAEQNLITLCNECHAKMHSSLNRKPRKFRRRRA